MHCVRALVIACLLAHASSARADTVEIDFDFGDSTMRFLGTVNIPPGGTIHSMGATTTLPAIKTLGGMTSVQTGIAQLKDLTLNMTVRTGSPLAALVTGTVIAQQVGTSTGPFTNTRTVMFGGTGTGTQTPTQPGMSLFISAHLNCFGLFCAGLGDFPISIVGTQPPPPGQAFSLFLGHLNTPGSASVTGDIPISLPPETTLGDPFTGTIFLTGNEISRTYEVPEPGQLAQLLAGAVALASLAARRAPRGRARQ